MRRLAGASVLVVVAVLLGAMVAWAAPPELFQTYNAAAFVPPEMKISGVTFIDVDEYLVVDQNLSDALPPNDGWNGWILDPVAGATAVNIGVDEPTGVHYDQVSDTLFISSDEGFIRLITSYNAGGGGTVDINTAALGSGDTEDPAYDANKGILYWMDGSGVLYWVDPVNGVFGDGDDTNGSLPFYPYTTEVENGLNDADWESLTWDPETNNLMAISVSGLILYEFQVDHTAVPLDLTGFESTDVTGLPFSGTSGMGVGPASTDPGQNTLWTVNEFSANVHEFNHTGSTDLPPPPPTTTSSSTTTTKPAQTTTTTKPGQTTTTTTPGGGGGGGGGGTPSPGGFTDIAGHTHEKAILWMAAEGITQGCTPTKFCPNDKVTRGQMGAFLGRAFEYTDDGGGGFFTDTVGHTFERAIDRLKVAGVTQGCTPTKFCPNDTVTRGQMGAFLVRAFGYTDDGGGGFFTDTVGHTFERAIDRLKVAGVTQGCSATRFCPNDEITRGQLATFLKRGFDNQ